MTLTLEPHTPQAFVDPYAADPAETAWPPAVAGQDMDHLLPPPNPSERLSILIDPRDQHRLALHAALTAAGIPPNPSERLSILIDPRDQHRLALHAALTAAGIPPRPEDRDAIDQLSALPSSINTTLQRWLLHTA
ncbi:hypothetical protein [Streptomyces sp. Root369]|uniref:hypothetical protein n=1 Tax=Streptomyces sp. Root369 TaxID=1736523 RepID=UPI0007C63958|nr:hypothetical protein [Streptomyces sp. Root369]